MRLFLENGGDVHAVDLLTGRTTLHVAATTDLVDTVDSLLDQGLDIEARDKNGDTPLRRAAARGTPEVIQRLVDRGADLSTVNNRDQTPLMVSLAVNTSLEGPKILLQSGSNVHAADQRRNTVLHYAVRWNECSLLNEIIELGGDVNAVNIHGYTPLHHVACESFSLLPADTIKILLKAGVGVDCRDKLGNTPLHIAIAQGNHEVSELFIRKGSDVRATNLQGRTCAHMINNRVPGGIVEGAVLHGGQVNAVDELGSTPLHLALLSKDWKLAKRLLNHGSDPNAVDYKGSTPLHAGCCSGNKQAVSIAIDYGRQVTTYLLVSLCPFLIICEHVLRRSPS